jgi:hypothetical protein
MSILISAANGIQQQGWFWLVWEETRPILEMMTEEMNIDQIIDALAMGEMPADEAVRRLVELGMTEENALYQVRSMETVDIRAF